jgi:uncharacterized protein YerC
MVKRLFILLPIKDKTMENNNQSITSPVDEFFEQFLLLESQKDIARFLREVCTPQEISAMAERWRESVIITRWHPTEQNNEAIRSVVDEFFEAFFILIITGNKDDVARFLGGLCTPQEILIMAERWHKSVIVDRNSASR